MSVYYRAMIWELLTNRFRFIDKGISSNRGISKSNGFREEKGKLST